MYVPVSSSSLERAPVMRTDTVSHWLQIMQVGVSIYLVGH